MKRVPLSVPELAIISGTRAALGMGIGLLIADRLTAERRKGVGVALLGVGLISTVPILAGLASAMRAIPESRTDEEGAAGDGEAAA
jgi:hypothetical protein